MRSSKQRLLDTVVEGPVDSQVPGWAAGPCPKGVCRAAGDATTFCIPLQGEDFKCTDVRNIVWSFLATVTTVTTTITIIFTTTTTTTTTTTSICIDAPSSVAGRMAKSPKGKG